MLGDEIFSLAQPDAVFAGARSFHGNGALYNSLANPCRFAHFLFVGGINQHDEMEIAVADMAEQGNWNADLRYVLVGCRDAFGEPGNRYADVGREAAATWLELQAGEIGVMAGLP